MEEENKEDPMMHDGMREDKRKKEWSSDSSDNQPPRNKKKEEEEINLEYPIHEIYKDPERKLTLGSLVFPNTPEDDNMSLAKIVKRVENFEREMKQIPPDYRRIAIATLVQGGRPHFFDNKKGYIEEEDYIRLAACLQKATGGLDTAMKNDTEGYIERMGFDLIAKWEKIHSRRKIDRNEVNTRIREAVNKYNDIWTIKHKNRFEEVEVICNN